MPTMKQNLPCGVYLSREFGTVPLRSGYFLLNMELEMCGCAAQPWKGATLGKSLGPGVQTLSDCVTLSCHFWSFSK